MSAKYAPGDKVKVTFEGKVVAAPSNEWVGVELDDGLIHWVKSDERVAKVEKQEGSGLPAGLTLSEDGSLLNWLGQNYIPQPVEQPEYETFGPGSLIRHRRGGNRYLIGREGYYSFHFNEWYPWDLDSPGDFTSQFFERVEVG